MASEIEIVVKVKDQATAETAAIGEKIRADLAAAGGKAGGEGLRVPIEPDATGFEEKVHAETRQVKGEPIEVPLELDSAGLLEKVEGETRRLRPEPIKAVVEADTSKVEQDINDDAASIRPEPVAVPIEADASKLEAEAEAKAKAVKTSPVKVPLEVDPAKFEAELLASFAEGEKHADAASSAMLSSFKAMESGIRALRAASDELKPATEAADDFETEFRKAMDEGARVSEDADRALRQSFTSMESGSRALRAAVVDLEPPIDNAGKKAAESGNGFSLASLKMVGLIAGAASLAPALAAIPAVTAAVVVGAGTMALGFGGVIGALKDYGQQAAASGQSGAQLAATEFSNAVAIRNAQQAIADAKKQAARSAQDSAEQIASAEQGVGDAERQAATAAQSSADQIASAQRGVQSSAYSLAQAEQALQDAEKSELDAQKALTQARVDAANQLADLNNSAADSHLAVQRATLDVSKAQDNLRTTLSSSLSTDAQKKDAQLALLEAQQGLIDAKQRDVEATQQANDANKAGVNGLQSVVQAQDTATKAARGVQDAQHNVTTAMQGQADAQQALVRAVQAAANQQVSSAESVAKAQQGLADAQRTADRQRVDSAESVAKAEQNLADTYKQQQLAAAAAAASGSSSANAFAQDMAKLTPAGRAFVNQILSMKGSFDQLKSTAQTSMLPGFMPLLSGISSAMPGINNAIGEMGKLIGGLATQFGHLLQDPSFRTQLGKIFGDGLKAAQTFSDGVVPLVKGVTDAVSNAGPIIQGLADGFSSIMTSGIPAFFQGLVSNGQGAGQLFSSLGGVVSELAGPIGTIAGSLASALAPAVATLATPQVSQALQSIGTSLAQIITVLSPVVTMFAQGLAGALKLAAPLLQATAKFMQDNHTWIVPLAGGIAAAAVAWWGLNAAMAANPLVLVTGLIAGLVMGLIYAWEHFKGFRDFMKQMWRDIQVGFDEFLAFIKQWWPELLAPFTLGASEIVGHWNSIVAFVKQLPGRLASAGEHAWDWVRDKWNDAYGWVTKQIDGAVKTVSGLPGRLASAGAGMWDWVKKEFLGALNGIAGAWNSLRFSTPSFHIPIPFTDGINVDSVTVGVPPIGPFKAAGGAIRGGLSAIIGDGGWEPLRLPDGTTVIPHANAMSAAASGAIGGHGGTNSFQVEWVGGNAGDEFLTWLRKNIRIRHGSDSNSVQKFLGQSF